MKKTKIKTKKQKEIASLRIKLKIISLFYIFLFTFLFFPMPILADEAVREAKVNVKLAEIDKIERKDKDLSVINNLPENKSKERVFSSFRVITAYNSEVAQCDDTPCETANGFNVCEHKIENTVAANFLPLGTTIKIPELFGDRIFVVRDRMNKRYSDRVDVWMESKPEAKLFGVKYVKIEVLE